VELNATLTGIHARTTTQLQLVLTDSMMRCNLSQQLDHWYSCHYDAVVVALHARGTDIVMRTTNAIHCAYTRAYTGLKPRGNWGAVAAAMKRGAFRQPSSVGRQSSSDSASSHSGPQRGLSKRGSLALLRRRSSSGAGSTTAAAASGGGGTVRESDYPVPQSSIKASNDAALVSLSSESSDSASRTSQQARAPSFTVGGSTTSAATVAATATVSASCRNVLIEGSIDHEALEYHLAPLLARLTAERQRVHEAALRAAEQQQQQQQSSTAADTTAVVLQDSFVLVSGTPQFVDGIEKLLKALKVPQQMVCYLD
jgi:hypothetical protein